MNYTRPSSPRRWIFALLVILGLVFLCGSWSILTGSAPNEHACWNVDAGVECTPQVWLPVVRGYCPTALEEPTPAPTPTWEMQ